MMARRYHWGTATAEVELLSSNEILYTTVGTVYVDKVHLVVKPHSRNEHPGVRGGELNRADNYAKYRPK